MSKTAYRTWIYGESVGESMMNEQIRDNGNAIWVGTTAGDMDYYAGAANKARLAIGTAGQVLTVNPGATAPLWGNGGMTLIETKLLAAPSASFDFTSIPAIYSHLKIILHGRSAYGTGANDAAVLRFNNDTGNNYDFRPIAGYTDTTVNAVGAQATSKIFLGNVPLSTATAGMAGSAEIIIPNYKETAFRKNCISTYFCESAQSTPNTDMRIGIGGGHWRNTDAINRITIFLDSNGNFIIGSMASLYGLS